MSSSSRVVTVLSLFCLTCCAAGRPYAKSEMIDLSEVKLVDGFWFDRFERARTVTLPRLWDLAGPWAWNNMQVAAGVKQGEVKGCRWEDAWIYKWIESACYFHAQHPDPDIIDKIDEIIEVIAKAQQPDGYIATQVTLRGLERLSFNGNHELYTMGHLMTAACAHYRITGKTNLLHVACRAADWAHKTCKGPDPMLANCPINPSIIMGAVDLYRATGERRYLELANIIINNRGRKRGKVARTDWGVGGYSDVNQDRIPLRQSREVVGHAVFWSYLYAGAADAYMETGDKSLMTALERLWVDLTSCKLYITGGVCPMHKGLSSHSYRPGERTITNDMVHEAADMPYVLPNSTAYNETCGQIGNVMWNWRMLNITGDPRYAEIMERTIYNAVLSGVNVSGQGWSYTNPLRWYGHDHELLSNDGHGRFVPGEKHICCPSNLLRTEASWNGCLYGKDAQGILVHHYASSLLDTTLPAGGHILLRQETRFPWDGDVRLTISKIDTKKSFAIKLRIPGWAQRSSVKVNGKSVKKDVNPSEYIALKQEWKSGDVIELHLPMDVSLMTGHPRLEHTRGQVAVMRGPVVYCLESTDLPPDVRIEDVHLRRDAEWNASYEPDLLQGVTVLTAEALVLPTEKPEELYRPLGKVEPKPIQIRMIPYYAWNNREEPEMTIWLPLY